MEKIIYLSTSIHRSSFGIGNVLVMFFLLGGINLLSAGNGNAISLYALKQNECAAVIDQSVHQKYGCAYPMTYRFKILSGDVEPTVWKKYFASEPWSPIQTKTAREHFNAVEAARFDTSESSMYVSVAFHSSSDSVYLRFTGPDMTPVAAQFHSVAKYYDNRKAAVTVSADDWADWSNAMWEPLLSLFRRYGLYVTAGIIADSVEWSTDATWKNIQRQLDSGFVEAVSHSGTHPHIPYADVVKEVIGSHDVITEKLSLPPLFRNGATEHVYVWIAPYGEYDVSVDTLLQRRTYIVPRLYYTGEGTMKGWNEKNRLFDPIGLTLEIGLPSWGGGTADTGFMNSAFRTIIDSGGVYHLQWHPQVIYQDRDKPYLLNHLSAISGRNDLWYVNLGHLYLYRLLQQTMMPSIAQADSRSPAPPPDFLEQNYPNPFNPSTTIRLNISRQPESSRNHVSLKVYDLLGREVAVLLEGTLPGGDHAVDFTAEGLPSGVYYYRATMGSHSSMKKMILLR